VSLLLNEEAVNSQDSVRWQQAMDEEMASLATNETWEVVLRPNDQN